jgi:argininosuccinate synthase
MQKPTVALAFSGGLDTSYCVPRLAEQGFAVHTVYVNTGGSTADDLAAIAKQARAVGAIDHHEVDARAEVFTRFVRYLIQGNVLRGEVYPLSVSAERTQQAISVIDVARQIGAVPLPMARPAPATTRSASMSRSACWPPTSGSSLRSGMKA